MSKMHLDALDYLDESLIKSCIVCGDAIYNGKKHPTLCQSCMVCPYCDSDAGFAFYDSDNTDGIYVCTWCGADFHGASHLETEVKLGWDQKIEKM